LALGDLGSVWLPARDTLREIAQDGRERRSVVLSLPVGPGAGSAIRTLTVGSARDGALVIDRRTTAIYAESGSDVIVADPSGTVARVADSACDDVAALVPAGDGRVVLACSSGLVAAIADAGR
jgi:hypothetical protein